MNTTRKHMFGKLFVIAIVGALSLLSQVKADNLYFRLDGIDGESGDAQHSKWIELVSFCHGAAQSEMVTLSEENGRGVFDAFVIRHHIDKATPKFQEACMKGMRIGTGEVHVCRQISGSQSVVYKVSLEGIKVSHAVATAEKQADGSVVTFEDVTMLVNKLVWTATTLERPENADGLETVETTGGFDTLNPEE